MRKLPIIVCGTALSLFAACGGSTSDDKATGGASGKGGVSGSGGTGGSSGAGGTAGAATDATKCAVPSDCVLLAISCCGSCGAVTRGDAQALNKAGASKYTADNCATVDCPHCFQQQDPTLLATCAAGQCVVVDLLTHPSTSCGSATDCRVRTNACCECGGPTDPAHLIAVSSVAMAAYDPLVCDPGGGCPECAPIYPPTTLNCINGHCQIATL